MKSIKTIQNAILGTRIYNWLSFSKDASERISASLKISRDG